MKRKISSTHILGKSCLSGYQSHYILTTRNGGIHNGDYEKHGPTFDELVVFQEPQIVPAFIVEVEKDNFMEIKEIYFGDRELTVRDDRKSSKAGKSKVRSESKPNKPGKASAGETI